MIEEKPIPHEIITPEGEVMDPEDVAFAYTREGRRRIGKEFPNPIPLEPPIGFVPMKPLHEQIRDMVVREMSARAEAEGFETAEEADDFDVGDDFEPQSPWEHDFEPTEPWPPRPPVEAAEAVAVQAAQGGGGAEPPSAEPPAAPGGPPAKPT